MGIIVKLAAIHDRFLQYITDELGFDNAMMFKNLFILLTGYVAATLITAFLLVKIMIKFRTDERAQGLALLRIRCKTTRKEMYYVNPTSVHDGLQTLLAYILVTLGIGTTIKETSERRGKILYWSILVIALLFIFVGLFFTLNVLGYEKAVHFHTPR